MGFWLIMCIWILLFSAASMQNTFDYYKARMYTINILFFVISFSLYYYIII